ncbi:MAG: YraN family protein [Microbacteriaceae bacterium]
MGAKDEVGRRGEALAAAYLAEHGLEILARNWRCPYGEIDIVAREGRTIVIAEVKTRSGLGYGHPFEAITPLKLARLHRLAGLWRAEHPDVTGTLRIDAVAVIVVPGTPPLIEHLAGVA